MLHHSWCVWHGGLRPAQISGQRRPFQLAQGLQTQPAVFANEYLNLITYLQSSLTQEFGREPHPRLLPQRRIACRKCRPSTADGSSDWDNE